jgi:hypothetical protein
MAAKAGTQVVLDEMFDPAVRARIDPEVWRRIEAGAAAGAEIAKVLESSKGEVFLSLRDPMVQERLRGRLSRDADAAASQVEGFNELKGEIIQ